jgi:hypothetical protein
MNERLVPVRLPYKVDFVRKRHRNPDFANFWDDAVVLIREVDPADAPVVYRVFDHDPLFAGYRPEDGYCIRSIGDSLWWPLAYRNALMTVSKFEELAASGNTSVLRAFAPSIRAGGHMQSDSAAVYFKRVETRKTSSSLDASLLAAQSGSHRTAFVGDIVHVEAGAPLYFATGPETRLQVLSGSSSPDRKDDDGNCNTPSVSLFDRRRSAMRGFAFGIGEIDEFMSTPAAWGAVEVRRRSRIEAVGPRRRHDRAAPLCARFLAEAMWTLASMEGYDWTTALRYNVSAVAGAARSGATYEGLPHGQVLEQLAATDEPALKARFAREICAARNILERLALADVADEDDAALSELSCSIAL